MLYNVNKKAFVCFFKQLLMKGSMCSLIGNCGPCTDTEMKSPFHSCYEAFILKIPYFFILHNLFLIGIFLTHEVPFKKYFIFYPSNMYMIFKKLNNTAKLVRYIFLSHSFPYVN